MNLDPRYAAIIREWADDLAPVVGRSAAEIREKGLLVEDFPHQELEIQFVDESSARFKFAFFVESQAKKAVAVFTEHCGYFVLPIAGLKIRGGRNGPYEGKLHR
jgi:hypothetical protein